MHETALLQLNSPDVCRVPLAACPPVHASTSAVLQPLTPLADLLRARLFSLRRHSQFCVAILALCTLIFGSFTTAHAAAPDEVVTAKTVWSIDQAAPGDQRALAVVLDIAEHHHINPSAEQIPPSLSYLIPTSLSVTSASDDLRVGSAQFPKPELVTVNYSGTPEKIDSYQGRLVVYLPIAVTDDASEGATARLELSLQYQACNETSCFAPRTITLPVELSIAAGMHTATAAQQELFKDFDASSFATIGAEAIGEKRATAETPDTGLLENDFLGWRFSLNTHSGWGLTLVLLVALVAGFLLNFTPCVLPVIPLKVMSLHQQAGNPKRCMTLGAVYGLGIIASFVVLGALVAGLIKGMDQLEWGEMFGDTRVSWVLTVVIVVMALGMMGAFTIRLPARLYMFNPSHETYTGNFLLGVLTAVLSTPCTGPMLGATIGWALKQGAGLTLGTFGIMGVGMALPYVVLTMNPRWVDRLPRTGPASNLVKQVLGLLLLAVAAFFAGPLIPGPGEWYIVAALIVAASGWMLIRTWQISQRLMPRVVIAIAAISMSLAGTGLASALSSPGPIPWQEFSPAAFDKAQAQGKTVLLEFTAEWCGNCKALELTTYRDQRLADVFNDASKYVAFKIDLTSRDNQVGWQWQRKLGAGGGIPLAAVYHASQKEPHRVFQGLFTAEQLLTALEHASGK